MLEMKPLSQAQIEAFKSFVSLHDFFYVAGHKEPDGDCVASCVALSMMLRELGKPFQLLSAGPFKRPEINRYESLFSSSMRFLLEGERKRSGLFLLDCSERSRLGDIDGDLDGLDTFTIDHHKTALAARSCFSIIDETACAASAITQALYEGVTGRVPKDAAEILFLGISTDTGYFRFLDKENAAETFRAAARLVERGASPRDTYDSMTGGKPWGSRKLLGALLSRAERYLGGRLAVTYETMEDTQKWGQEGRDSDALYQALLSTKGVDAAVFARQEKERVCTAGFRSRGDIDVSAVAGKFGGGGHKNASGMSVDGKVESLIPAIVKEFAKIL